MQKPEYNERVSVNDLPATKIIEQKMLILTEDDPQFEDSIMEECQRRIRWALKKKK